MSLESLEIQGTLKKSSVFYYGNCDFEINDMQRVKFTEYIKNDDSFLNVFKHDLTCAMEIEMDRRIKSASGENHGVFGMTGETGSGKSITALGIILHYYPNFNADSIFWENQDILDNLKDFTTGQWVMRDETLQQFGMGSMRVQSSINMVIETLRKAGINFIFLGAIDREVPTAHWYFEIIQRDSKRRVNRVAIRDNKSMKYLGYMKIKVLEESNPVWIAYNERKDYYMKLIQDQEALGSDPFKIKDKLIESDINWVDLKKNEIEVYLKTIFSNKTIGEIKEMATVVKILIDKGEL